MSNLHIKKIAELISDQIPSEQVILNEEMSKHTTFKIGGCADIFIKANTLDEIQYVVKIAKEYSVPLNILGNGSNILVNDNGIKGIVLKINLKNCKINSNDKYVIVNADAGMLNSELTYKLLKAGITGFEFACGIPGTIGGAIKMNAGASGKEFKDIVKSVKYLDIKDNKIKILNNEELKFSYRHSIFQNLNAIILSAELEFSHLDKEEILKKIKENIKIREEKQPIDKPSAGSTFKRGEDYIASKLIDECGLKGATIGGAQVSEKHAGFIVNINNAKATEVIKLINLIQKTIFEKTGKKLELEIELW